MNKKYLMAGSALAGSGILAAYYYFRRTIPKGVAAVQDFNRQKYLGNGTKFHGWITILSAI